MKNALVEKTNPSWDRTLKILFMQTSVDDRWFILDFYFMNHSYLLFAYVHSFEMFWYQLEFFITLNTPTDCNLSYDLTKYDLIVYGILVYFWFMVTKSSVNHFAFGLNLLYLYAHKTWSKSLGFAKMLQQRTCIQAKYKDDVSVQSYLDVLVDFYKYQDIIR